MKRKSYLILLLLTFGALLLHGYHPYAEDAEIYVPGIVKMLHPAYYPTGQEFFETHAHLTLYPKLIAWTASLTHLPLDWTLFLWHVATIFLLLMACRRIAAKCFPTEASRWAAVGLVAALLTLPIAGTSLYILDQYLNPRSFSAFAVLFAIDAALEKKYFRATLWLIATAVIHPLMTVFGLAYIVILIVTDKMKMFQGASVTAALLPGIFSGQPSPAYWASLRAHRYYYLLRWTWYEWLGIIGPLAILWWFSEIGRRKERPELRRVARATFCFCAVFLAGGLAVTIPRTFEVLALYQPMRSLLIVYIFLALLAGGLLGEAILKHHALRWILLFAPLCAGMWYAQLQLFPLERHIEWPGAAPTNPWMQAFMWARQNTPTDANFALDPDYMALPDESYQGFRATAERSRMADGLKDWSAAALFPNLPFADDVQKQVEALKGWKNFGAGDYARLKQTYGVTWMVVEKTQASELTCPYENQLVKVCRVD